MQELLGEIWSQVNPGIGAGRGIIEGGFKVLERVGP